MKHKVNSTETKYRTETHCRKPASQLRLKGPHPHHRGKRDKKAGCKQTKLKLMMSRAYCSCSSKHFSTEKMRKRKGMFIVHHWCMLKGLCLHMNMKKTEHLEQHIPAASVLGEHSTIQMCFRWHEWDIFSERNNKMQQFSQN